MVMCNIVEIRKIGEQRMLKVNRRISKAEKQVEQIEWNDKTKTRKQGIVVLNELYEKRGKLGTFLEVLGEIRNS